MSISYLLSEKKLGSLEISRRPMAIAASKEFEAFEDYEIRKIADNIIIPNNEGSEKLYLQNKKTHLKNKTHFRIILDRKNINDIRKICIENCSNFTIDMVGGMNVFADKYKFFITISGCRYFEIENLSCNGGENLLFISGSEHFSLQNCNQRNATGSGIIINNVHDFKVSECVFTGNASAGILIVGNSFNGEIENCTCSGAKGFLNHDAGIHLCCTSDRITPQNFPKQIHEPLSIEAKTQRPHHIVIKNCSISNCRAQGLYLEGAMNCLIEGNSLVNNNKEGICFDWGSCYNFFRNNIIVLNGKRADLSEKEIHADFISGYPLLPDGSSSMKLPGISLDNGCMNIIENNILSNNYGGGVKMIRAAMFNKIENNQILFNAIGANKYVPHFHGVTLLGVGAVNNEFTAERSKLLDFLPSVFNTIANNEITGHWRPVFSDKVSSKNSIYDNYIPKRHTEYSMLKSFAQRVKAYLSRFLHTARN